LVTSKQQKIILIADPQVLSIPAVENGDPMFDLCEQKIIAFGPSPEIPNNTDYTKMRKTVYEKLLQAQSLLPQGLRLCLYEGYRSLTLQNMLFTNRYNQIKAHCPNWSEQQVFEETTKLVSPVINIDGTKNIPPHSTGGAIDVYLINDQGEPVEMGIHPSRWTEDMDGSLSLTFSEKISNEAKHNRSIMNNVLESVEFVNYPTEYWHWSYGDRYWAYHIGHPHAIYESQENEGCSN